MIYEEHGMNTTNHSQCMEKTRSSLCKSYLGWVSMSLGGRNSYPKALFRSDLDSIENISLHFILIERFPLSEIN